ncbi:hypothetical protein [Deinococcus cavernae]|uniref:hypothetical protein n=1 Tax=Deinococcus cavernae TaxID=2320857 RepID=UPI0011C2204E|nr:hypothetical protein [Deinococcus cavernae]
MFRTARTVLLASSLGGLACAQQSTLNAAEICAANPRVEAYGMLAWSEFEGASMPYDLTCPDFRLWTAGKRVMVKATDIKTALALFGEASMFLSYYADLFIHYDGQGKITADPVRGVTDAVLDDLFRLKITVTPRHGQPHLLLNNAMPHPLTLPADQPFTIDLTMTDAASAFPLAWQHIEIDPARATISAELGEQQ